MVSSTESSFDLDRLRNGLEKYLVEANREMWKAENDRGMVGRDLEKLLIVGLAAYYRLRELDAHWAAVVQSGLVAFDPQAALQIEQLYAKWRSASESVNRFIAPYEAIHGKIENAAAFRAALDDCPRLDVARTMRAIESEGAGRSFTREETINELRRRILPRGN